MPNVLKEQKNEPTETTSLMRDPYKKKASFPTNLPQRKRLTLHQKSLLTSFKNISLLATSLFLLLFSFQFLTNRKEADPKLLLKISTQNLNELNTEIETINKNIVLDKQLDQIQDLNQKIHSTYIKNLKTLNAQKIDKAIRYEEKLRNEKIIRALKYKEIVQRELQNKNFIDSTELQNQKPVAIKKIVKHSNSSDSKKNLTLNSSPSSLTIVTDPLDSPNLKSSNKKATSNDEDDNEDDFKIGRSLSSSNKNSD